MSHRHRLVVVTATVAISALVGLTPARSAPAAAPDPLYPLMNVLQLLSGPLAPTTEFSSDTYANPSFLPDWDHNGIYGDEGDVASEQNGAPAEAAFLYPCIFEDSSVTYETTTGDCAAPGTPGVEFRRGLAQRFKLVDAFGLALTATLWLPDIAREPGAGELPGLVFSSGASVPQRSFYMYAMTAARAGFVVLTYDPVGQGTSEGDERGSMFEGASASCPTPIKCRELQQLVRWFTGTAITPESPRLGAGDPATNPDSAALGVLDLSKVAIAGQSNGGLAVSNYLELLPTGRDADGRPLPPIAAAVALSGFAPASAVVPVQAQTADLDIPGVTADNFGSNVTDGPLGTKAWYEELRASGDGDGMLQLLIQEGGSHGDTSNIPGAPHAVWAWGWSTGYFVDFLSCTVLDHGDACGRAIAPRTGLSRAYASEYDPDGAAGPSPSRCINIPDRASLLQLTAPLQPLGGLQPGSPGSTSPTAFVDGLLGAPGYTCEP
ncbi:MAG: alpha/beta hydrolase family protein [Acidimicrobiales bacterium]